MTTRSSTRQILSMNFDWRFHLGDIEATNYHGTHARVFPRAHWMKSGNHGISTVAYSDRDWRIVDLPHDFVVEGTFTPEADLVHGSLPVGIGWYRKTFHVPEEDLGKAMSLEFDGIYRNFEIWCNGHFVGRELSGYGSFAFEISDVLEYGKSNTVAIRVDATDFELWSYEGGGIYRDARMVKTHAVHVPAHGVFVRAEIPDSATPAEAELSIETTVGNRGGDPGACEITTDILDAEGRTLLSLSAPVVVAADGQAVVAQKGRIAHPRVWGLEDPHLHTAVTRVSVDGEWVDSIETRFGIRSVRFDPESGFFLNGVGMKLKGVCNHQDHAGVGVAIPHALQEWRIGRMKSMGVNAIRCSHNPATPEMLEICDRLGVMVMDEIRMTGTSSEHEHLLENLVVRGRNHPSVILWSMGNEEMLVQETKVGVRMMKRMHERIKRLDPTRPTTYAMNCDWIRTCDIHDGEGFRMDVFGTNYRSGQRSENYDDFHAKYPDWPLVATETGGSAQQRGVYAPIVTDLPVVHREGVLWTNPAREGFISAYGETCTPWGYSVMETWQDCASRPFLSGTFLWTGFDYRGETYPCSYPTVITSFGISDLCGFPKDAYWYLRAWWRDEPLLHIFPHWNWSGCEGQPIDVWCFSNCAEVELSLNGKSLGRKSMPKNGHLEWVVDYEAGRLEARGFDREGGSIITRRIETNSAAASVCLEADRHRMRADNADVIPVTVSVLDDLDRAVADAGHDIRFSVTGPARILGVGNGDPNSHEPDKADRRRLYQGLAQVLVQSTREAGEITLLAESDGLVSARLVLQSDEVDTRPWVASLNDESDPALRPNPVDNNL